MGLITWQTLPITLPWSWLCSIEFEEEEEEEEEERKKENKNPAALWS
jgi:hypothetical protein